MVSRPIFVTPVLVAAARPLATKMKPPLATVWVALNLVLYLKNEV